ncbi:MAG: 50S ribosomal protein L4 [Hydrogenothermaceae bacterium]
MQYSVVNKNNQEVGKVELREDIFNVDVNQGTVWEVIKWHLASKRAGTASTKTRAEVAGSNRKIYPQKGTGRARHGDIKANIFVGGGVSHGPHPRDYYFALPKKVRKKVLKGTLTFKVKNNEFIIVEDFNFDQPKTKNAVEVLKSFGCDQAKVLLVLPEKIENVCKSFRNIPKVKILPVEGLNSYDILNAEKVIVFKSALDKIQERLGQ